MTLATVMTKTAYHTPLSYISRIGDWYDYRLRIYNLEKPFPSVCIALFLSFFTSGRCSRGRRSNLLYVPDNFQLILWEQRSARCLLLTSLPSYSLSYFFTALPANEARSKRYNLVVVSIFLPDFRPLLISPFSIRLKDRKVCRKWVVNFDGQCAPTNRSVEIGFKLVLDLHSKKGTRLQLSAIVGCPQTFPLFSRTWSSPASACGE